MSNEPISALEEKTAYFSQLPFPTDQGAMARAPLTHTHSHYTSKLYTSTIGVNPLVAAASPILSLMGRLRSATHPYEISELYLDLIHEIKSFESHAQRLNYRAENILIARYLLTSTLDETILNTAWGKESEWEKHKLLMFFQQEEWGGERFFVILERLEEEPLFYVDLLELAYICLSLGFEGKFRYLERGHYPLNEISKNLFYKIQQIRHELKPDLNPKRLHSSATRIKVKSTLIPVKLFLLSAFFSLAVVGTSFTSQQWQQLIPFHFLAA